MWNCFAIVNDNLRGRRDYTRYPLLSYFGYCSVVGVWIFCLCPSSGIRTAAAIQASIPSLQMIDSPAKTSRTRDDANGKEELGIN